jgi:hypothetical protein
MNSVLRRCTGGYVHWCPACEQMHRLPDSWSFTGDLEKPTFQPSYKHSGKLIETKNGVWTGEWVRDAQGRTVDDACHYIVNEGASTSSRITTDYMLVDTSSRGRPDRNG